ncbi:MAG: hypothetical protein QG578_635 [Thermodesulfobacteriota bacterium]|nr:hypothetical protein [Thermodesulfobacteriota bacterium]
MTFHAKSPDLRQNTHALFSGLPHVMDMKDLNQKREIILRHELAFADEIGSAVFEKPKVSYWMVFIPILFLYFLYRMQKFKNDRIKFNEEFMTSRRLAMENAIDVAEQRGKTETEGVVPGSTLPLPLQKPYASWIETLSSHYLNLLAANGDDFESLVRAAYRSRDNYMLTLEMINNAEKDFYTALKPLMAQIEGTAGIITTIESQSRRLRHETACRIFN